MATTAFILHLDNSSKTHFGSVYLPPSPQTALDIMRTPGQVEMTPQICSQKCKTLALNQNCMTGWEHGKVLKLYMARSGLPSLQAAFLEATHKSLHQNTEKHPAPCPTRPKAITSGKTPLTVHHLSRI